MAILQAGEFPLWFQFTDGGPLFIESIEDAVLSSAFVPWPLAPHVRFMLAWGDDILMAVNREGILRFSPLPNAAASGRVGLYRYSGGEFWQQYTVGAFFLFDIPDRESAPTALLYYDDRFLNSHLSPPASRSWTFDPLSGGLVPVFLSALEAYPPQNGWDIDVFRRGGDGNWYFRAIRRKAAELRMLRTGNLAEEEKSETISLGVFQNAALPEPLSAAPESLRELLAIAFNESGGGVASIVSPEFTATRSFATDRDKPAMFGFFSGGDSTHSVGENPFLLVALPHGDAWYLQYEYAAADNVIRSFSLPDLPEGFFYTGIGLCGDTIIASWEEQNGYSIGAAGMMVIKLNSL